MGHQVILRVYKLGTPEMLNLLNTVLKENLSGIWHTSIEIYNKEIYFANKIIKEIPNGTIHGIPHAIHIMGETNISEEEFDLFLQNLEEDKFGTDTYNILTNNCNHFTDECSLFLVNKSIPSYISEVHELANKSEHVRNFSQILFPGPKNKDA